MFMSHYATEVCKCPEYSSISLEGMVASLKALFLIRQIFLKVFPNFCKILDIIVRLSCIA